MVPARLLLATLFLVPCVASAHQISGTIRNGGDQPLRVALTIECPGLQETQSATTDPEGRFSFFVAKPGQCTLHVDGATYTVYSSQDPVRYDFVLDGGALRRR